MFEILSRTLRGAIAQNPQTKNRVEIYERALTCEKLMEWSIGKHPEERLYEFPQIVYQWKEFRKQD